MKAHYKRYVLNFKSPGCTSRGVLTEKETWFLYLTDGEKKGIGECSLFRGLSADDRPDYEDQLKDLCDLINQKKSVSLASLKSFPSIQMGYEMAMLSLQSHDPFVIYPSRFVLGEEKIRINGLVWMGELSFMKTQIDKIIDQGFDCIKLKIGNLDFDQELSLLSGVRKYYDSEQLMLRVDANGAFSPSEAPNKLKALSELDIHSIEQPIKAGQVDAMHQLCVNSPIPIALDEELIGVFDTKERKDLLDAIMPQYLILKPSLLGGFKSCEHWIDLAEQRSIGWWVTSALESNIGLNAISQWTYSLGVNSHQGLGTGGLFTNNFDSPLEVRQGYLTYNSNQNWEMPTI